MRAAELVNWIFYAFYAAIITRSILSFIVPMVGPRPHPVFAGVARLLYQVTEPILAPIRRILPTFGTFDFSPMVAIILLGLIHSIIRSQLNG